MKRIFSSIFIVLFCLFSFLNSPSLFAKDFSVWDSGHIISSLNLQACPDETVEGELRITASSENTEDCQINLSWSADWLSLYPTSFVLPPGGSRMVALTVRTHGLKPGYYQTKIIMQSNCKPNYSEIPVLLEVLSPALTIEPKTAEWALPYEGSVTKELVVTNRMCETQVQLSWEVPEISGLEIIIASSSFRLEPGESKKITITFRCFGFEPKEGIKIRIIVNSSAKEPIFGEYRLLLEQELPIIRPKDPPAEISNWINKKVIIRGYLVLCAAPFITSNPYSLLSMQADQAVSRILLRDPDGHYPWSPIDSPIVSYQDTTGILKKGSPGQPYEIWLSERPKQYFPLLYPFPRLPHEALPQSRTPKPTSDYLIIIGSNVHPVSDWIHSDLIMKWETGMFFNTSTQHMAIFFGDGSIPALANYPKIITERFERMKPYMQAGRVSTLLEHLKKLETTMRSDLRNNRTPTLTILMSGYSQYKEEKLIFQLQQNESLELEDFAQTLERVSILGEVRFELNFSYSDHWAKRLSDIGHAKLIVSSQEKQETYTHQADLEKELCRWLKNGKAGSDLGKIDWVEVGESIHPSSPFAGDGIRVINWISCQLLSSRKSHLFPDQVRATYLVKLEQQYHDNIQHTSSEHSINIDELISQEDLELKPTKCPDHIETDILPLNAKTEPQIRISRTITTEGNVTEIDSDIEGFHLYDPFFDTFREVIFPERPLPVSVGDRVRITGTRQGERRIIPETIEILEQNCAITISEPADQVFCPTCLTRDMETGYFAGDNDFVWNLANVGDVGASITWHTTITELTGNSGIKVDLKWIFPSSQSVGLNPGQSFTAQSILEVSYVPEEVAEEVRFKVQTRFTISPSPPCTSYIDREFEVVFCPNKRNVRGVVSFKNVNDQECPIKNIPVRLYLKYDPECGHDPTLYEEFVNIYQLHESYEQGLPSFRYYLETTTNNEGRYSFDFIDKDCDHRYRIIVIFKTNEMRMTYKDCRNTFFANGDTESPNLPCKPVQYQRDIKIGISTDLHFPSNFVGDPRAVAQSFCHMQECFDVFRNQKCADQPMIRSGYLPVNVCIFSDESGTWYDPNDRKINIDRPDSGLNSPNRPMNREWHEFGHFLHDALMGLPPIPAGDENHGGFSNGNSSDSFVEGIAEMTSLLILQQTKQGSSCCGNYEAMLNSKYLMGGGGVDLENDPNITSRNAKYGYFNAAGNWVEVPLANLRVNASGQLIDPAGNLLRLWRSDEELAAAAVLKDLIDNYRWYDEIINGRPVTPRDDDGFSFPQWQDLFCLLKDNHVKNMKELYDALRSKYSANEAILAKINGIFVKRGFFEDRNFNGTREAGEAVGTTFRPAMRYPRENAAPPPPYTWVNGAKIESRPDFPPVKGSAIYVKLRDKSGEPVPEAWMKIHILGSDGKVCFSYPYWIENETILYLYLAPNSNGLARVSLENGNDSVVLINEATLWQAACNGKEHAGEHTFIVDGETKPGQWQWDPAFISQLSLVQGKDIEFPLLIWNTGTFFNSVQLESSETWINIDPNEWHDAAGRVILTVKGSQLQAGKHSAILQLKQGHNVMLSSKVEIEVLPPMILIQLQIGNKKAFVNDREVVLESPPYIKPPGRTMVPLRLISEGFGASIDYAPKQGLIKDIWVLFQIMELHLKIGSSEAWVNSKKVIMDAPAEIVAGRTFVPIRFISETFGAKVDWEAKTQKIVINLKR